MKGIKIGDKVVTRHTPPIKGICTQILSRGRDKEYQLSYNKEGDILSVWLNRCELVPEGDEAKMGFSKC